MAIQQQSDAELLVALRADGRQAFEVLFERYSDFVYNFAFRRTGSWSEAEEVVEIVLLELWRQRDRVVLKHGSLRPWMCGVALNCIRRSSRSRDRQHRAFGRVAAGETIEDPADAVVSRLDDEVRMTELLVALEALPVPQREVLTLFVWEELSYEEIASALDLPVGTVRSRLSRARAALGPSWQDAHQTAGDPRSVNRKRGTA
ncbi:MAG TPA: RNA polymerase sigma factor [Acidimicrobiales bacterium]|nr:RNA polymerase sigma factor [Acidimicrobiales bacterium]